MNDSQALWWEQAKSDFEVFELLRAQGVAPCHALHYLQMATEKIAKAYLWRQPCSPPPRSHAGFVQFLRFLGQVRRADQERIAQLFNFGTIRGLQSWVKANGDLAYALERISPALAGDGPNTEYPWPHVQPTTAPVNHSFELWAELTQVRGRNFMRFVRIALERFPEYADI